MTATNMCLNLGGFRCSPSLSLRYNLCWHNKWHILSLAIWFVEFSLLNPMEAIANPTKISAVVFGESSKDAVDDPTWVHSTIATTQKHVLICV